MGATPLYFQANLIKILTENYSSIKILNLIINSTSENCRFIAFNCTQPIKPQKCTRQYQDKNFCSTPHLPEQPSYSLLWKALLLRKQIKN